ncbi:uncharacterized protein LOC141832522 [Curcuma longa]|uniref:uncharacterized protein LOC141832522 n=1 Tax=Curcuma longa TaxID=136217 RepID=UPI003D9DEB92
MVKDLLDSTHNPLTIKTQPYCSFSLTKEIASSLSRSRFLRVTTPPQPSRRELSSPNAIAEAEESPATKGWIRWGLAFAGGGWNRTSGGGSGDSESKKRKKIESNVGIRLIPCVGRKEEEGVEVKMVLGHGSEIRGTFCGFRM